MRYDTSVGIARVDVELVLGQCSRETNGRWSDLVWGTERDGVSEPSPDPGPVVLVFCAEAVGEVFLFGGDHQSLGGQRTERGHDERPPGPGP